MHNIYEHWHPPLNPGTSCCNKRRLPADPAPTSMVKANWRAWNGAAWLSVPQERVLPSDYAGDGPLAPVREGGLRLLLHARRNPRLTEHSRSPSRTPGRAAWQDTALTPPQRPA